MRFLLFHVGILIPIDAAQENKETAEESGERRGRGAAP